MSRGPTVDLLTRRIRKAQGQELKAARVTVGISQEELGDRCGLPQDRISKYELGRLSIPDAMKVRMAQALGRSPDDIFSLDAAAQPRRRKVAA